MSLKSIAALYLREYPRLICQLARLGELAVADPNYALVALFGSAARFEPRAGSDADLLFLSHNPSDYFDSPNRGSWLVIQAEDAVRPSCMWPFSAVVSDADAGDLDESFLAEVARDGVLVYMQEGARPPKALAGLLPFEAWLRRVDALLAECRAVLALDVPGAAGEPEAATPATS